MIPLPPVQHGLDGVLRLGRFLPSPPNVMMANMAAQQIFVASLGICNLCLR